MPNGLFTFKMSDIDWDNLAVLYLSVGPTTSELNNERKVLKWVIKRKISVSAFET